MSLDLDKSTWKRVAFGDVIENVTMRVDDPSAAGVDRYVGLEHLDPGVMTVQRWDSPDRVEAQKLRFRPGDVIFGRRRAYQKKVARADFEGICSAHALVLRARPDAMKPDFLPVFLSSDYFLGRAISISVGSLSPTVNWRDLKAQEFDLPPLDEQRRIADLLWAIERHRLSVRSVRRAEEAAGIACRSHVFGTTDTDRLDRFVSVDLGRQRAPQHAVGNHMRPYIRAASIVAGNVDLSDIKTMNFTPAEQVKFRLRDGDVLLTEGCGSVRELGNSAVWRDPNGDREMYFQKTLIRLRPVADSANPSLVREWARWARESGQFASIANGTGILHITAVRCATLPYPNLSADEAERLAALFDRLEVSAQTYAFAESALGRLRASLLARIFGGGE